jgi:hypothetical protein
MLAALGEVDRQQPGIRVWQALPGTAVYLPIRTATSICRLAGWLVLAGGIANPS